MPPGFLTVHIILWWGELDSNQQARVARVVSFFSLLLSLKLSLCSEPSAALSNRNLTESPHQLVGLRIDHLLLELYQVAYERLT